jgi:hypothetical protein
MNKETVIKFIKKLIKKWFNDEISKDQIINSIYEEGEMFLIKSKSDWKMYYNLFFSDSETEDKKIWDIRHSIDIELWNITDCLFDSNLNYWIMSLNCFKSLNIISAIKIPSLITKYIKKKNNIQ